MSHLLCIAGENQTPCEMSRGFCRQAANIGDDGVPLYCTQFHAGCTVFHPQ